MHQVLRTIQRKLYDLRKFFFLMQQTDNEVETNGLEVHVNSKTKSRIFKRTETNRCNYKSKNRTLANLIKTLK